MSVPIFRAQSWAFAFLFIGVLLSRDISHASPHVVGYERFHVDSPNAAGGAILFSELGCANCHGGSDVAVPRSGPSLNDISDRVSRDWVVEFLKDPESRRKGSTMPNLAHGLSDEEVESVTNYLGTLGKGLKLRPGRHANAENGSALYHEKGCVACHAPTADYRGPAGSGESLTSPLAISHPDLKKKTTLTALDYFLSNPARYRTDGRMPHIALDKQESLDIAAHLLDFQASDPREADAHKAWPKAGEPSVQKGKSLVAKLNCIACHAIPGKKADTLISLSAPPEKDAGHCLSASPTAGIPSYKLTEAQRSALVAFLKDDQPKEPGSREDLSLAAMNCYACHDRNGIGGPTINTNPFFHGLESLGDSGRLPPPLTGIGDKLQTEWLEGVLTGKPKNRVRPYMKTSMPAYAKHAKVLADWFVKEDLKTDSPPITIRPDDIEVGKKLLGIQGGVNCITCHNWGEQKSLGIPALDISSLDQRLRPHWFREYLLNPASYRPGTLMPPLWPQGKSMVPDVLDGNAERQIAAIWGFIKEGEGKPEGFPDHMPGQFELTPIVRPIIQRTFLEKTGTKAILVGFPGEIHLAYDGSKGRPALVWRGKFFDAYNTWFVRSAPFENPLSDDVYEFEASSEESGRFRGYKTDGKGNPTFLISKEGQDIEDSFRVAEKTLIRTLTWKPGEAPTVTHPKGVSIEEKKDQASVTFTYSWK